MSLIDTIKSWFGSGPSGGSGKLYIVDAVDVLGIRSGRIGPRDMISLLHRLGGLAQKERIELQAVFEGEPLRKAPDDEDFQGVYVTYAADAAGRRACLLDLLKKGLRGGRTVTVISADAAFEKEVVALGGHPLRAATFRKALAPGGSDDRGGARGGRGGGSRGGRRRSGRRGSSSDRGGNRPERPRERTGNDVSDLIDIVE